MPNLAHASRTGPRMLVSKPARLVGGWRRSWCPGLCTGIGQRETDPAAKGASLAADSLVAQMVKNPPTMEETQQTQIP